MAKVTKQMLSGLFKTYAEMMGWEVGTLDGQTSLVTAGNQWAIVTHMPEGGFSMPLTYDWWSTAELASNLSFAINTVRVYQDAQRSKEVSK